MGCSTSIQTARPVTINSSSTNTITPCRLSSAHTNSHKPLDRENNEKQAERVQAEDLLQNFLLIWLDSNIDESNQDFQGSIKKLRRTVNTIENFRNSDECINYISSFKNEKLFLVISGTLCEKCMPHIHSMSQIYSIYIFCRQPSKYEQWATKEWPKVKGIFTEIDSVCVAVRQTARECDDDNVVITSASSSSSSASPSSAQIEPTFMYSLLFKEIVLELKFDNEKKEIKDLVDYVRNLKAYVDNEEELAIIDEFAREYQQCFIQDFFSGGANSSSGGAKPNFRGGQYTGLSAKS